MKSIRRLLAVAFVLTLLATAWLWMKRPQKADMTAYAPAEALVYLESNSLVDIAQTLVGTDAWRALSPYVGKTDFGWLERRWLRDFVAYTGIGSTPNVVFARAQVAVVMLDLGATEQGETLTIKPEAAILIETHTSERRIRSAVEETLQRFAEKAYKQPIFRGDEIDGVRFMVWTAPAGGRQIAALIDGSFVILGNTERSVKICLDVRRGQRASLRGNPELQQMRFQLAADRALAFGFVSSLNASRLFSIGAPLFFGNAAAGFRFDSILASSAAKVLGGLGWSSQACIGGIEDRYLISLQPTVISRLRPEFRAANAASQVWKVLPNDIYSLTIYKFDDPVAMWKTLGSSVSSQLDTLSSVVFNSLLKSSLLPYGIEEPEKFLRLVGPELVTVRLNRNAEQAVLLAQVRDEHTLRTVLTGTTSGNLKKGWMENDEVIEIPGKRSALSFLDGYVILGMPDDVRRIQATHGENRFTKEDWVGRLARFMPLSNGAGSLTYTNESERVRDFLSAVARVQGATAVITQPELERTVAGLPYSATDTILGDHGLLRTTRSSFGQFSALLPLLFPDD